MIIVIDVTIKYQMLSKNKKNDNTKIASVAYEKIENSVTFILNHAYNSNSSGKI